MFFGYFFAFLKKFMSVFMCAGAAVNSPQGLSTLLFEIVSVSPWDLRLTGEAGLAGQAVSPRSLSVICLSSTGNARMLPPHTQLFFFFFSLVYRELNSGLHLILV